MFFIVEPSVQPAVVLLERIPLQTPALLLIQEKRCVYTSENQKGQLQCNCSVHNHSLEYPEFIRLDSNFAPKKEK